VVGGRNIRDVKLEEKSSYTTVDACKIFTFAAFQFEVEAYLPNPCGHQFLSRMLFLRLHSNIHDIHPILMGHRSRCKLSVSL
jgi:hypothetical protein